MSLIADSPTLLSVRGLCKHFPVLSRGLFRRRIGVIKACDGVSFDLARGETLGIVGESGSGKSTLVRSLLRVTRPSSGSALFYGEDPVDLATLSSRELRRVRPQLQMIFRDPFRSLDPRRTIEQIVAEPLRIQRRARGAELEDRVITMLRRVGIRPEDRGRYPDAFSGGQRQRIGIARALILEPALVVADEAVSSLDVSVQAQIVNLLRELQEELGLSYLFIARDLALVRHMAQRVAVMKRGMIVELGETERVFDEPQQDYTRRLLGSVLDPDPDRPRL
ncbi:MAG TPA: ATP-binding cassette domain-containing protein [Polyangiaceae bacterium]|nr:ATP-binding cassette domain-containing protein [Polyangiaceae bacterium]